MTSPSSLPRPIEDRRFFGISLFLVGVALFACLDASAKYLVVAGIPAFQVAFVRHLVTLILVVGLFAPRYGRALFRSNNLKLELVRGLCVAVGTVLHFASLKYLPLTVSGSILFTMPLIVTALSVPLLGERVGWRRWIAILVGFTGVLIVIRPGGMSFHPAVFLTMTTAVLFSIFNILNRKLAGVDSVHTLQFYASLVCVICLAPGAATQWVWPDNNAIWLVFGVMGLFGTVGHFLATAAHRFAGASTLAPYMYPQIIFMALLSWLLFNQPPDIYMVAGALVVIGAGLYIWTRERGKSSEEA